MEDYLDKDPVLSNQKYVCLSILTNNSIKDTSGNVVETGNTARGIKVRGCYSTMEEAQKRCEQIRQFDKVFNVFIGEVGAWLPWEDDPDKAEDAVYAEEKLNQLMKSFKEQQIKAKEYQEYRKQADIENAIKKSQSYREKHKIDKIDEQNDENKIDEENVIDVHDDSDNDDESDDDETIETKIDENIVKKIEVSVNNEKKGLSEYKKDIKEKENNIANITSELEKARKLFEELTKKVNEEKK